MRALLLAMLFAAGSARAGGYAVSEQDAAATGRGGTGTAALGGATSVHYNPAHLSRVFSIDAAAGGTGIMPTATAKDPATGHSQSANRGLRLPPHAYAAYGNGKWGAGLGFNAPFGGGLRWGDDFRGRFEIVEQSLQVLAGHAGFAYQVRPELSFGGTLSLYRATVGVERRVDFVSHEGTAHLRGSGTGVGATLGASYAPSERVRVGLTARLPTRIGLAGRAHFEDVPPSFSDAARDQDITASLPLPARVATGVAVYLSPLRLFADVDYTTWSAFDRFAVDFAHEGSTDVDQLRQWRNAFSARVGAEWDLNAKTMVRAGLLFDQKTSPADTLSPSLPDSDRVGGSVGLGYDLGAVRADVAYMFIQFLPRTSEGEAFPARYSASAHLLALTVRFATPPGVAQRSADVSDHRPLVEPPLPGEGLTGPGN
jgi:long-chain fatty acid transport protein